MNNLAYCFLCSESKYFRVDFGMTDEHDLVETAKEYLKSHYGEDTVFMTVKDNKVANGTGTLSVDCTVSLNGHKSDWSKKFHFRSSEVVNMDARLR